MGQIYAINLIVAIVFQDSISGYVRIYLLKSALITFILLNIINSHIHNFAITEK